MIVTVRVQYTEGWHGRRASENTGIAPAENMLIGRGRMESAVSLFQHSLVLAESSSSFLVILVYLLTGVKSR